jgi:hypothetical protein
MKNLIQAAVVTLFAASTAQAQQAVQWRVEAGGNGHWYAMTSESARFWALNGYCTARGGHLATFANRSECLWVGSQLPVRRSFVGGYQDSSDPNYSEPNGGWKWVTGEPFVLEAATPYGFDNYIVGQNFAWFNDCCCLCNTYLDDIEDVEAVGVIEWSADCNGDGIVDYGQCRDGTLPDYDGNNIPDCCERGEPCMLGHYPVQWRVSEGGNGHWYQRSGPFANWDVARVYAPRTGAHLATLTSATENQIASRLNSQGACWVGGFQLSSACEPGCEWRWVSGEPWDYTNWAPGQPDNYTGQGSGSENYLQYFYGDQWNDGNGADPQQAVFEWSADCNNDGIVDKGQILRGQLADLNTDGVPDICQQPTCVDADIFRDFNVNGADLGILLSQWGPNTPLTRSDLNRDGVVDGADLGVFLSFWGPCPN